jgi:all-trans-retinol 13,14-reductase
MSAHQFTFLFMLAPWLLYFPGELLGRPAWGAAAALTVMGLWWVSGKYRLKSTDWTQCLYFALVAAAAAFPTGIRWPLTHRSLLAPALFAMMAFGSLLVGHPFTNQFAREQIPAHFWNDPNFPVHFARVNTILTWAWGLNFCISLGCAALLVAKFPANPWLPRSTAALAFIAVCVATRFFPAWYERHVYRPEEK